MRIWRVIAEQIQDAAVLERWRSTAVLLERCTAESVKQDLKCGVGANLMQRFALVLEYLFPGQRLGLQNALFGWPMHMLNQIPGEVSCQQRLLLLDEGFCSSVSQVFDGLASEDSQLAPT